MTHAWSDPPEVDAHLLGDVERSVRALHESHRAREATLRGRCLALEGDMARCEQQLRTLSLEHEDLRRSVVEKEAAIATHAAERDKKDEMIRALQDDLAEARAEVRELRSAAPCTSPSTNVCTASPAASDDVLMHAFGEMRVSDVRKKTTDGTVPPRGAAAVGEDPTEEFEPQELALQGKRLLQSVALDSTGRALEMMVACLLQLEVRRRSLPPCRKQGRRIQPPRESPASPAGVPRVPPRESRAPQP
tara:strand:- start:1760 stop:2503 length:744 start_codon:yes stop_codon:yes gene_type:complete